MPSLASHVGTAICKGPFGRRALASPTNKPIEVAKSTSDQQYEWCIGAAARLRRGTGRCSEWKAHLL